MSIGESHIASTQRAILVNMQVIEYLQNGGEIQEIPPGVSGEQLRLTTTRSGLKVWSDPKHKQKLREINTLRYTGRGRKEGLQK